MAADKEVSDVKSDAAEKTPKHLTQPKGRPTPKQNRRPATIAPPKDSKEARKQMRERMREERAARYQGMKRGDDKYLTKRDAGPVRRLTRDIVDARRNIGPWFFFGTFFVVLGSLQMMPPAVRSATAAVWLMLIVLMVGDAILLSRRVSKIVAERHPDEPRRVGLYLYAIMRSVVFRRWRNPKPAVELGDPV